MYIKKITLIAILFIGAANCQNWKILTIHNSKLKFDNLPIVQNDTLIINESDNIIKVPIQNISIIGYNNFSVLGAIFGAPIGGLLGFPIGIKIGLATVDNYETGAIPGLVIGAIVGAIIFSRAFGEYYTLSDMAIDQKVDKINKLIEKYEK
jgi:hypothetical protein